MDEHFGAACQRTIGVVSITKNVVLLAFCSCLLISVTVSAQEDPETGVPNVLLIGLCHAVIIVVRRADVTMLESANFPVWSCWLIRFGRDPVQSETLIAGSFFACVTKLVHSDCVWR